ncbi:hypothetical protein V492_01780 [Pseudogymnoascus sp. VKM F-4246]|nr:hypothetical protein V492_01780 [Pseudogymnoascus sp. VKM F-4246]
MPCLMHLSALGKQLGGASAVQYSADYGNVATTNLADAWLCGGRDREASETRRQTEPAAVRINNASSHSEWGVLQWATMKTRSMARKTHLAQQYAVVNVDCPLYVEAILW